MVLEMMDSIDGLMNGKSGGVSWSPGGKCRPVELPPPAERVSETPRLKHTPHALHGSPPPPPVGARHPRSFCALVLSLHPEAAPSLLTSNGRFIVQRKGECASRGLGVYPVDKPMPVEQQRRRTEADRAQDSRTDEDSSGAGVLGAVVRRWLVGKIPRTYSTVRHRRRPRQFLGLFFRLVP